MPGNNYLPRSWFLMQPQIEHFAGTTLFTVDATPVDAPASWPDFADLWTMLSSYAALPDNTEDASSWLYAAALAAGAPGAWTMQLNAEDKVQIVCSAEAFAVSAAASALWGLAPGATVVSVATGGQHVATLPANWLRGVFDGTQAEFTLTGTGATVWAGAIRWPEGTLQSVPAMLQTAYPTGTDPDLEKRPADNVNQLLRDAVAGAPHPGRFCLDDAGRVRFTVRAAFADPALDTEFLSWLGFDSTDTFQACAPVAGVENMKEATASRAPRGLVQLARGCVAEPTIYTQGSAEIASDGYIQRNNVYTIEGTDLSFTLQGAAVGASNLETALEEFFGVLWSSAFFLLVQDHLEHRRGVRSPAVYSPAHSPEWAGRVGTKRLTVHPSYSQQSFTLASERSRALYSTINIPCFPYVRP